MEVDGTYVLHDIQAQPVIVYDHPSSSSSSSSPSTLTPPSISSLPFVINLTLLDFEYLPSLLSGHDPLGPSTIIYQTISEPPLLSSIVLNPVDPNCWVLARAALASLGLETHFHDQVLRDLHSCLVHMITTHQITWALVDVSVVIKRFMQFPILHFVDLDGDFHDLMEEDDEDEDEDEDDDDDDDYDYDYFDFVDDRDYEETLMIFGSVVERVSVEEEKISDKENCTICLEQLVRVKNNNNHNNEEEEEESVVMRLPCKHYFHKGCIFNWFRKSDFCPLCRCNCLPISC